MLVQGVICCGVLKMQTAPRFLAGVDLETCRMDGGAPTTVETC